MEPGRKKWFDGEPPVILKDDLSIDQLKRIGSLFVDEMFRSEKPIPQPVQTAATKRDLLLAKAKAYEEQHPGVMNNPHLARLERFDRDEIDN